MGIKIEFEVGHDQVLFSTQTNGDRIAFRRIHLGPQDAANLAELINTQDGNLSVKIKQASDPD